ERGTRAVVRHGATRDGGPRAGGGGENCALGAWRGRAERAARRDERGARVRRAEGERSEQPVATSAERECGGPSAEGASSEGADPAAAKPRRGQRPFLRS